MKYPYMVNKSGVYYPAGTEVPEDTPIEMELTDDVPDGALETNADGSVNAYDKEGNLAGTVDADTVKTLEENAGKALKEQAKSKGSKKK